jgi:hypothetical protein
MAPPNAPPSQSEHASTSMVSCPDCGREVPEMNLTIHKVRACHGRARIAPEEAQNETGTDGPTPMDVDDEEPTKREASPLASSSGNQTRPAEQELHTPTTGMRRRRSKRRSRPSEQGEGDTGDDDILQVSDVVDLSEADVVDLVSPGQNSNVSVAAAASTSNEDDEWACPQCTLLNSTARSTCDACNFRNPNRPPDPTRSERLIYDHHPSINGRSNSMPMSYVGHGALLGGMLGAAGSFVRGSDLLSGAAEGAMTGVVGGALLNEVLNVSSTASENYNPNISEARSSAAMGTPAYPSFASRDETVNRRARPRSSYRVIQRHSDDGNITTIIQGGSGGSTQITRRSMGGRANINDPMLSLLLHNIVQQGGRRRVGVDGMDYEQLLQAFGDGTENMGAQDSQINRLPTRELKNPETELPEDARQCLICLEDFAAGETRITMPCLHGFHQNCAQKWLRTNGSCPICKHRLE